jgi:hypothetical protein
MNNATLILTTPSTSSVQVQTVPVACLGNRADVEAVLWAEKLFALARPCSGDAERFVAGIVK